MNEKSYMKGSVIIVRCDSKPPNLYFFKCIIKEISKVNNNRYIIVLSSFCILKVDLMVGFQIKPCFLLN